MKHNAYREAVSAVRFSEDFNDRTAALLRSRTEAAGEPAERCCAPRRRLKPALAAGLALLLLAGGFSGYAFAAEVKEYRAAVAFFAENALSAEGLTRGEIKNVYRDITTGKFSYEKTAEVIAKSVGGYELFQQEPTPEAVEGLWNYKNSRFHSADSENEPYRLGYADDIGLNAVLEKYDGDTLVWSAALNDLIAVGFAVCDGGIVVYGDTPSRSSGEKTFGRLALVDAGGSVLWDIRCSHGYRDEWFEAVVCDETGIAVFGRGDFDTLFCARYGYDGREQALTATELESTAGGLYGVRDAVRLGDGYLVRLSSYDKGDRLLKVSADGSFAESFTYSAEDAEYFITGMLEYHGKIYLSAYSVPKLGEGEETAGGRYDIAAVLNEVFDRKDFAISNSELTKLVRDNFTAVLLLCDPESGVPGQFYSVKGSLGAGLSIDGDGRLVWKVESIADTYLSLATSSFTIGGASYVYEYAFDAAGACVGRNETGEVAAFRR